MPSRSATAAERTFASSIIATTFGTPASRTRSSVASAAAYA